MFSSSKLNFTSGGPIKNPWYPNNPVWKFEYRSDHYPNDIVTPVSGVIRSGTYTLSVLDGPFYQNATLFCYPSCAQVGGGYGPESWARPDMRMPWYKVLPHPISGPGLSEVEKFSRAFSKSTQGLNFDSKIASGRYAGYDLGNGKTAAVIFVTEASSLYEECWGSPNGLPPNGRASHWTGTHYEKFVRSDGGVVETYDYDYGCGSGTFDRVFFPDKVNGPMVSKFAILLDGPGWCDGPVGVGSYWDKCPRPWSGQSISGPPYQIV